MNKQIRVTAANAVQMLDAVLWMMLYTATEGAGRVQGIRGHFGGSAFYVAVYLSGADHDPASPTRTAPSGTRPSTAHRIMIYGTFRWFPYWTAENTARRLGNDKDHLVFQDLEEGAMAKTTQNGNGGRLIVIKDSGTDLNNAVTLQHEAHRDGIVDANNKQETYRATLAHTKMAAALYGKGLDITENLARDLMAYKMSQEKGSGFFREYSDQVYDSSADYWKINANGTITWDGNLNFYDETGNDQDSEKGKVLDYRELANVLNGMDPNQTTVLLGETEVQVSRLREIFGHNEKIIKSGTIFGLYTSKAAEYLLQDGFMSYDEASSLSLGIYKKGKVNMIEHYSARYVLNETYRFEAMTQEERAQWRSGDQRDNVQKNKEVTNNFNWFVNGSAFSDTGYLQTNERSIYHGPNNFKWVFYDSGKELIIDQEGEVERRPQYIGTYNWGSGPGIINDAIHYKLDIEPYFRWGNTPDDYYLTPWNSRISPKWFPVNYDTWDTRWGNKVSGQ